MAENSGNNHQPHFVFATEWYKSHNLDIAHESVSPENSPFRELMKKNQLETIMVTALFMERYYLITKEKMKKICQGDDRRLQKSFNDDLEILFEDLETGRTPTYRVDTYFLPQLTEIEMALIDKKDRNFLETFRYSFSVYPDVPEIEMKMSDSKSKFFFGISERSTFRIDLTPDGRTSHSMNGYGRLRHYKQNYWRFLD